jgi:hypothetical protein
MSLQAQPVEDQQQRSSSYEDHQRPIGDRDNRNSNGGGARRQHPVDDEIPF